jgi:hypothetical protein
MDTNTELELRLNLTSAVNVGLAGLLAGLFAGYVNALGGDKNLAIRTVRKGLDESITGLTVDGGDEGAGNFTAAIRKQLAQYVNEAEIAARAALEADQPASTKH